MERKKVLIIEDDAGSSEMLQKLICEIDVWIICYKASTVKQAYEILHENIIDVFIIDIILDTAILGDVSGIRLAEEIRAIDRYAFTPILFITALEDPKLYAYSVLHSFKYIEKPFLVKETKESIREALRYKTVEKSEKFLHFRKDGILFSVKEDSIIYMESKAHMLYIYTTKEKITIPYKTCKKMLVALDERWFVQCSRSAIVNRRYIYNIDTINLYITFIAEYGCRSVSIGKRYLDKVLEGIAIC